MPDSPSSPFVLDLRLSAILTGAAVLLAANRHATVISSQQCIFDRNHSVEWGLATASRRGCSQNRFSRVLARFPECQIVTNGTRGSRSAARRAACGVAAHCHAAGTLPRAPSSLPPVVLLITPFLGKPCTHACGSELHLLGQAVRVQGAGGGGSRGSMPEPARALARVHVHVHVPARVCTAAGRQATDTRPQSPGIDRFPCGHGVWACSRQLCLLRSCCEGRLLGQCSEGVVDVGKIHVHVSGKCLSVQRDGGGAMESGHPRAQQSRPGCHQQGESGGLERRHVPVAMPGMRC